MKKNKLGSILLSLFVAFGLWLYVINYVSPGSEATYYNIPVVFDGETVLTERNLMISSPESASVTLRLSGNRSDLIKINESNIVIKVDLTKVYEAGEKQLSYTISYPGDVPNDAFSVESQNPKYINLTVEKRVSNKPIAVQVNFIGSAADGFMADTENWTLDYSTILVSGPSSVVDLIDHARIDVDLTDRMESLSENYRYILCDAEGNPVDVEKVTTDVAEVRLDVKIQRHKTVPVVVDVIYGGGADKESVKVEVNPASINVTGSEALLAELEEIPLGTIDLATIEENTQQTYTITLPEGVNNESGKTEATVDITFSGLTVKEFTVEEIQATNVPEGMEYVLMSEVLKVKLRGKTSLINAIKPEDIVVTIDFTGKEAGSFTIKPIITVEGDAYASVGPVGSHIVSVTLKQAEDE